MTGSPTTASLCPEHLIGVRIGIGVGCGVVCMGLGGGSAALLVGKNAA